MPPVTMPPGAVPGPEFTPAAAAAAPSAGFPAPVVIFGFGVKGP